MLIGITVRKEAKLEEALEKYASLFFGVSPDVELFKFKSHKRAQFIEEKVKKIIALPGEIGFIARLGLL